MSVVWSGVTESGAVVPVQVDGLGRVIATTGEPPGPPEINYNGASAWANFDGRGNTGRINARGAMNIARITKVSTGLYQVDFQNPLGSSAYSVVTAYTSQANELSPAGFLLSSFDAKDGTPFDLSNVFFAVHSINALPPMGGGTGANAWGSINPGGGLADGFNVGSTSKIDTGTYEVIFTTPMPNNEYSLQLTCGSGSGNVTTKFLTKEATGFTYNISPSAGTGNTDGYVDFAVFGTNSTLPVTYTREQIDAVINNWQKTGDTLSTKDAVEMNGPVRLAGGKAGFTDEGQLYFTPGPGPQKYLVGVEDGQMKLKRIDSAY